MWAALTMCVCIYKTNLLQTNVTLQCVLEDLLNDLPLLHQHYRFLNQHIWPETLPSCKQGQPKGVSI